MMKRHLLEQRRKHLVEQIFNYNLTGDNDREELRQYLNYILNKWAREDALERAKE